MRNFLRYCFVQLSLQKSTLLTVLIACALFFPALYAIGLIDQPRLVSYIENGYFYGSYQFNMYPVRAIACLSSMVVSLFFSSAAFAPFYESKGAAFNLMLPATRLSKFGHNILLHFVCIPLVLTSLILINDWTWSYFLEIPTLTDKMSLDYSLQLTMAFMALNSLFFLSGVIFKRAQWALATAFCILLSVGLYIYAITEDRGVRNEFSIELTPTTNAVFGITALALIGVSYLRFRKIELRA